MGGLAARKRLLGDAVACASVPARARTSRRRTSKVNRGTSLRTPEPACSAHPLRSGPLRRRLLSCPPHFPLCAALTAAALCNKCGELSFHVDCVVPIMSKIHHDSTRSMDRARVRGGAPGGSATNLSSSGAAVDWWAAQQWPNL